jgi:hypothetical protein
MSSRSKSKFRIDPVYLRPIRGFCLWSSGPARLLRALEIRGYSRANVVLVAVALCGLLGELIGGLAFDQPLAGLIIGLNLSGTVSALVYILKNY